ncbi:hypothetical protein R5R35_001143 [Gryllus longicercus]|uniref:dolichyl-P-Man:Man5GlcNAc2-PP-dolichol alpha-1,3-mannosyltransferase n=1 Tax=Gryllus longicercus TaxID=2509291 RepID=A0AAN9VQ39_9ORTH
MAPKEKRGGVLSGMSGKNFWKTIDKIKKNFATREFFMSLVFDPCRLTIVACVLLIIEIIVNVVVIQRVKYTELDWVAYMQEVEGVINGTLDYSYLKGDTGPLVYPAGFVYVFTGLYYLTDRGQNIRLAQYIFAGLYIIFLALVFRIYVKSRKVPPYALVLACCGSYRIHSIFILRLFNDPVAMLFLYAAINLFLDGLWTWGSIFFSFAVSIKMNILLFSPALLLVYLTSLGLTGTLKQLSVCAAVQLVLGLPFLLTNPVAYIRGAFDLGRVFLFQWTVNWRFLPESIFLSGYFHLALLILHLALLACFYDTSMSYLQGYARLRAIEGDVRKQLKGRTETVNMDSVSQLLLLPLFLANFVGVACSRSLHYQFYVWYFHSIPYLLWATPYSAVFRLCVMGVIELCWNTFPSTIYSSAALHVCHVIILYGLYGNRYRPQLKQKSK